MIRASMVGTTIALLTSSSLTVRSHSPGVKASSTSVRRPA
jgi:hypothetical protein